jgi:hypothetical protein
MNIVRNSVNEIKRGGEHLPSMGVGRVHMKKRIAEWLDAYDVEDYVINDDLTIDVNGDAVFANDFNLDHFPDFIRFNEVSGSFHIDGTGLLLLRGCPVTVGNDFSCVRSKVSSLMFAPKHVGGNFSWYENFIDFSKSRILKSCDVKGKLFTDALEHLDYLASKMDED